MSLKADIYVLYKNPIEGVRRVTLPEPRSYQKRQKEIFSWANNKNIDPLPFFFSQDIKYLMTTEGYGEDEIKKFRYEEKWFEPEDVLTTVTGLLDTARKTVAKKPTVKYFVIFLEALMIALERARNNNVMVHLSEAKGKLEESALS